MAAPRVEVDPPGRHGLRGGLVEAVTWRPGSPGGRAFPDGVQWVSGGCGSLATASSPTCEDPGPDARVVDASCVIGTADPVLVEAATTQSPLPTEQAGRAGWLLAVGEDHALERVFHTTHLQPAQKAGTAAVSAAVGLGGLEQWIGVHIGSAGVIHTDRVTATVLASHHLLNSTSDGLFTPLGTRVVAAAGYPAGGPSDGWVYGTPSIEGWRSDPETIDTFDHTHNNRISITQRTYLLLMEPCPVGATRIAY